MFSRTAAVFPGQGAYVPGVFAKMAGRESVIEDVLNEVDGVAVSYWNERVSPLLFEIDAPQIADLLDSRPELLNLAIFAGSVAAFRLVSNLGVHVDVMMGHSFGEFAAATAAGMLTLQDAARAVCERDRLFDLIPPPEGRLMAVALDARRTADMLSVVDDWSLEIAVDNGPRQTVVSGTSEGLELVKRVGQALGVDTVTLAARYPFHNRMLYRLGRQFAPVLELMQIAEPVQRMYSPILNQYVSTADDIRRLGVCHLTQRVQFGEALRRLYADGVTTFVECGPRAILSDLIKSNLPADVRVLAPFSRRADIDEVRRSILLVHPTTAQQAEDTAPADAAPAPTQRLEVTATPAPVASGLPPRAALIDELRIAYAEILGYPTDVLTNEADLEADLGIDSIKQAQMFARFQTRYRLAEAPQGMSPTSFTTIPAVADALYRLAVGDGAERRHDMA